MAAAPAHRAEYNRLAGVWSALDRVPDPRRIAGPAYPQTRTDALLSRRRVMVGGAASAGLVAAAALVFESGLVGTLTSDYHTAQGELRSVTLADDSRVELDADSVLSVAFTDQQRRVTLKRGRASRSPRMRCGPSR